MYRVSPATIILQQVYARRDPIPWNIPEVMLHKQETRFKGWKENRNYMGVHAKETSTNEREKASLRSVVELWMKAYDREQSPTLSNVLALIPKQEKEKSITYKQEKDKSEFCSDSLDLAVTHCY